MTICHKPLKAWRSTNGNMVFTENEAIGPQISLPCGQCIGCRLERSRQWAIRCMHESQLHERNCFITLTYADMPSGRSLHKDHLQKFWKRLRKAIHPTKIRYFACGEYGDGFDRPHYHAIIFGYDFGISDQQLTPQLGKISEFFPKKIKTSNPDLTLIDSTDYGYLWTSKTLEKIWGYGIASVAECSFETCAYVSRYVTKKVTGKYAEEYGYYDVFDEQTGEYLNTREPEFATMSRRNAIGSSWLEQYYKDIYPHNRVIMDGRFMKIPAYYDKWLEKNDPDMFIKIKSMREDHLHTDMSFNDYYQKLSIVKDKFKRNNDKNENSFPDLDDKVLTHYKHLRRMEK